ncbi:uncharacterized protein B0I36DRAFT_434283 [Microdochium trichocladiopsis]|uniref:Uncharacterized protein n=1 Tax=Microdochium trichocladiopsis TaxID=1682393 RepID=A0A9P8XWM4_9PEZI|nr:uncharacterized protein B0I36DRAFT_434283 [Microdochium trichocladiopsis]KAH7024599.1 hypothetical protein B0I36DRAFT_434283 [Microdochium trichocladiopsis]
MKISNIAIVTTAVLAGHSDAWFYFSIPLAPLRLPAISNPAPPPASSCSCPAPVPPPDCPAAFCPDPNCPPNPVYDAYENQLAACGGSALFNKDGACHSGHMNFYQDIPRLAVPLWQ